jgi:two-component system alkaline phosphatase synthesis response regulator PhoP
MSHRILVVDDDRQIVRLVQAYLEKAGYTVFTAYDGDNALRVIRHERPDLVVLDLMLPGRDGWEITRALRADERFAALPILMLTARVEDTDKILGLELGADDYLTKPFNPREVVARVRAILRRAIVAPTTPRIIEIRGLHLDVDRHTVSIDGRLIETTPTEFALLRTLMENPNHAFTRGELIEKALGYSYEGMERTLDSHIKNLRKKIEDDPGDPQYIETVFGVGYRLSDTSSPVTDRGGRRRVGV